MRKKSKPSVEPTDTITSIFTARRDLLQGVKSGLAGSGFTVEEADLLVSLYGVRELGWHDLPHDAENFVALKELGNPPPTPPRRAGVYPPPRQTDHKACGS